MFRLTLMPSVSIGADFVRRLHDSLPKIGSFAGKEAPSSSAVVLIDDSDEEIRMVYESWTKSVRFEYCDLTVPAVEGQPVTYAQWVGSHVHGRFFISN